MNPFTGLGLTDYLKIARDIAILAGVGFILWFVWDARGNKDKITNLNTDLKTVQQNATQQAQWQEGVTSALNTAIQSQSFLQSYLTDPDHNKPILVRVPATGAVQGTANCTGAPTNGGGVSAGQQQSVQQIDIRPVWNAYIAKYGQALIDGQKCYDAQPK